MLAPWLLIPRESMVNRDNVSAEDQMGCTGPDSTRGPRSVMQSHEHIISIMSKMLTHELIGF